MSKYNYKNKLKKCPNCGGELKKNNTECPYCNNNLVGFNELDNRHDVVNKSAKEMKKLARKIENIKVDNGKKINKKKFIIIVAAIFAILIFIGNIDNAKKDSYMKNSVNTMIGEKTYFELKEHLETTNNIEYVNPKVKNEQNDFVYEKEYKDIDSVANIKYDGEDMHILYEKNHNGKVYSVNRYFNQDILFSSSIYLSEYYLSYGLDINNFSVLNKFEYVNNYKDADEYILKEYAIFEDELHYIRELKTLELGNSGYFLNLYLYISPYAIDGDGSPKIVGVMMLDNELFYVTEIDGNSKIEMFEQMNEIIENPDDYFRMEVSVRAE